eukprot:354470-Chlamydomonas_euryale.AAC.14
MECLVLAFDAGLKDQPEKGHRQPLRLHPKKPACSVRIYAQMHPCSCDLTAAYMIAKLCVCRAH